MPLTPAQRDIVEKMKQGYDLRRLDGMSPCVPRYALLSGGFDEPVKQQDVQRLINLDLLDKGPRTASGLTSYSLTEQGRTIETLEKT